MLVSSNSGSSRQKMSVSYACQYQFTNVELSKKRHMNKLWRTRCRKTENSSVHPPPACLAPRVPAPRRFTLYLLSFSSFLPLLTLPAVSFNNTWGAEAEWARVYVKTVEESSKEREGKRTKRAETSINTNVMFKCKMVWWKTVWREEGEDRQNWGAALGFLFFASPLSYYPQVHIHLYWWAELSGRSILWIKERGEEVISLMGLATHH